MLALLVGFALGIGIVAITYKYVCIPQTNKALDLYAHRLYMRHFRGKTNKMRIENELAELREELKL